MEPVLVEFCCLLGDTSLSKLSFAVRELIVVNTKLFHWLYTHTHRERDRHTHAMLRNHSLLSEGVLSVLDLDLPSPLHIIIQLAPCFSLLVSKAFSSIILFSFLLGKEFCLKSSGTPPAHILRTRKQKNENR